MNPLAEIEQKMQELEELVAKLRRSQEELLRQAKTLLEWCQRKNHAIL